jgi:hypothetical protein
MSAFFSGHFTARERAPAILRNKGLGNLLLFQLTIRSEKNGNDTFFRNNNKFPPDCLASYPRR